MNYRKTFILAALALVIGFGVQLASAQNMAHTVVRKEIKFARGKSQATLSGSAKYGMSYVYELKARSGQTMEIAVKGKNPQLTFSLIGPDEETIEGAFGVTDWAGSLPRSGEYSVVVVMNDKGSRPVFYSLAVRIK